MKVNFFLKKGSYLKLIKTKSLPLAGKLIRKVIGFLRKKNISLPIQHPLLIAVSGGVDSVALSHLICQDGHRIIDKKWITLIHVNHQVRGQESDTDALFVQKLANQLGVQSKIECLPKRILQKKENLGESPEKVLRYYRKEIFEKAALEFGTHVPIWTAHHKDDQAETILWRILTGGFEHGKKGILFQSGVFIRPLLEIRKKELKEYMIEQNQSFCHDSTNENNQYLRSKMRIQLMPILEKIFPQAVNHLAEIAKIQNNDIQKSPSSEILTNTLLVNFLAQWAIKPRQAQLKLFTNKVKEPNWTGKIELAGGWSLVKNRRH